MASAMPLRSHKAAVIVSLCLALGGAIDRKCSDLLRSSLQGSVVPRGWVV